MPEDREANLSTTEEIRDAVHAALVPVLRSIPSPARGSEMAEVLAMAVHDATTCLAELLPEEDR